MSAPIEGLHGIPSRSTVLESGQYLFRLDDGIRSIYFVKVGCIHLIRHQDDGSVLILQKAASGSVVAEASVYSDKYHCDAVASGRAQVQAFARVDMLARLRGDPYFAEAWGRYLAHELQKARLHAEILSIKTVAKRLDAWIASHGGETPRKGEWKVVASEIGITPEAVYREMARRRR